MEKLLILGGTNFIGRNLVEHLLALGQYDITLFNRQQTQSNLFPALRKIKGDRETEAVKQIANDEWDYVIDLSCYYPEVLSNTLKSIKGNLKKYIFISTCSVYESTEKHVMMKGEESKILSCSKLQASDRTPSSYGHRKAECERILKNAKQGCVIFRPALVYGRYDPTDRFYYWIYQVKNNDPILLPDNGERLFSVTYVQDLVQTIMMGLKTHKTGTYNVISNPKISIKQIVNDVTRSMDKAPKILNISPYVLNKNNVQQWINMPLWIDGDHFTFDNKSLKKNFDLRLTDFSQSVDETISYYNSIGWKEPVYGITEQDRKKLIAEIQSR